MTSTRDLTGTTHDGRDEILRRQAAELERLRVEVAAWRKRYEKGEKRDIAFTNSEGEVDPLYTALDVIESGEPDESLPGAYPFTRGIHPTGYRGKLWTKRQFAGFGSATDTNARFKFLLEHGQTGLSTAFRSTRSRRR